MYQTKHVIYISQTYTPKNKLQELTLQELNKSNFEIHHYPDVAEKKVWDIVDKAFSEYKGNAQSLTVNTHIGENIMSMFIGSNAGNLAVVYLIPCFDEGDVRVKK